MLIRGATVFGAEYTDVRYRGRHIADCGVGLRPLPGEEVIDAGGGWLLPGLHDHHVHLRALTATVDSVRLGPPDVTGPEALAARLRRADTDLPAEQWIRGVGYHESVAGRLDRDVLNTTVRQRPVRIQHRSGALWMLNSRACTEVGLDDCPLPGVERDAHGRATGRLWRMDSWLRERLRRRTLDSAATSRHAARWGVTGFTDATPDLTQREVDDLARDVDAGRIAQRVHCMAPPGVTAPPVSRFTGGPTKILLDDHTLPTFDEFVDRIRGAHAVGRPVAVHCVTRVQLALTMAAMDQAGEFAGDRIEHGAIIPAQAREWLRKRRITVVTQPHFAVERAEQYAREVPRADHADLWRLGSLLAVGVDVAAGTDAPFGSSDPWSVIRAATGQLTGIRDHRRGERIGLSAAVSLFCGRADRPARPRTVERGEVADLTLLAVPPADVGSTSSSDLVAATIVDGHIVHRAL
ncbi:amidohydrolase family protein [Nocardia halotolerans]|uniref:Amidohydrolase family protein n=1 Tax=Nocardia halotolerans TaxID=1755878 RepID=A0ABV8VK55_9NOCA